jgi:hypothetical protein
MSAETPGDGFVGEEEDRIKRAETFWSAAIVAALDFNQSGEERRTPKERRRNALALRSPRELNERKSNHHVCPTQKRLSG